MGWAGLGWAGLGWAGLGWAGLGAKVQGLPHPKQRKILNRWAGLGWAGLGWAGRRFVCGLFTQLDFAGLLHIASVCASA